jgi:invasion protein IalB
MFRIVLLLACLAAIPSAVAQPGNAQPGGQPGGPQSLSRHTDWEVAFLTEQGRRVCYAFTREVKSEGAPAGRAAPIVTVTHRQGSRDQVALLAGFAFPANTEVPVEIGEAKFQFYTGGSSAFARDGRAVTTAFQRSREAVFRIPAGGGRGAVTDRASLRGFTAAYQALDRCAGGGAAPPRR